MAVRMEHIRKSQVVTGHQKFITEESDKLSLKLKETLQEYHTSLSARTEFAGMHPMDAMASITVTALAEVSGISLGVLASSAGSLLDTIKYFNEAVRTISAEAFDKLERDGLKPS